MTVYDQLMKHVTDYGILIDHQSGFRHKHSCETVLQLTLCKLRNYIDNDKYVVCVFLDLKRAFETVDRGLLLMKMARYGIGGAVFDWFHDYLNNRRQKVRFGDAFSPELPVGMGVPQGSVLGPLLFILYLNDIELFVDVEFLNLFADDMLVVCADHDLQAAISKMNNTLMGIEEYLQNNRLKLNVAKTKGMICTTKYKYGSININSISLTMNNENIEIVSSFKYLGFHLDNVLSFDVHFNFLYNKISKKLYFFSRVSRNLSIEARIIVYNSIVQPHYDYCASVLFLFNRNKINQLQKLQNRGMRIILGMSRYTPISFMLNSLQWLTVEQRVYLRAMVFVFKIVNNFAPSYYQEYVVYHRDIHDYFTRGGANLYIDRTNRKSAMNSLFLRVLIVTINFLLV